MSLAGETAPKPRGARRGGRCVLVGHRVLSGPRERDHDLAMPDFLALIDRLQAAGCTFASDLAAEPNDGAVVLTFDDGSSDHPALGAAIAERGLAALFFISVGHMGTPGHIDPGGLGELVAQGHTIGSHGWSHRRLDQLSDVDLDEEFTTSRARLEDLTGAAVTLFSPAGGIGFRSLPDRLRRSGYVASRSTRWGIHRRLEDRWEIPAVPVTHLTVARGWVVGAATARRLPLAMTAMSVARKTLSADTRTRLRRGLLRGRDGTTGGNG